MVQDEIKKIQEESDSLTPPFSKDEFIKIKTSLDSYDYTVIEQAGLKVLAIRSPEDYPDMVNDLETVAAGLSLDEPEDLTHVTIIGNSEVIGVPVPILVNLLLMKQEEDQRIVLTLREKLNRPLETYLFQDESDPHQLQRVAIMAPGSLEEVQEKGMREIFGGVPVPPDARVFYIVGTDGFFKLSRREYMDELVEVPEQTPIIPRDASGPAASEVSKQVDVGMDEIDIIDHSFTLTDEEGGEPEEDREDAIQDMFGGEEEEVEEFEEIDESKDSSDPQVVVEEDEEEEIEEFEEMEEFEEEEEESPAPALGNETRTMGPSDLTPRPPEARPMEEAADEEEEEEEEDEEEEDEEEEDEEEEEDNDEVEEEEVPVALEDIPEVVLQALERLMPGANVTDAELETEDGIRVYELTFTLDGKTYEAEITPEGEVKEIEVEEEDDDEEEIPEMPQVEPTIEEQPQPEPITEEEEEALLPRPSVVQDPQEMPEHEHVVMKPLPRPSVVEEQEEQEEEPAPMDDDKSIDSSDPLSQVTSDEEEPVPEIEEMIEQEEEEEDILQPKEVDAPPPIPHALEEPPPQEEVAPADTTGTEPEMVSIKKSIPMSAQEVLDERVKRERLDDLKKSLTLQGFIVSPQEDIPAADYIASKRYFNDVRVLVGFYKEPSLQEALAFERTMNNINLEVGMMVCDDLNMDMKLFTVGKNLKAVAWNDIDSIDGIVRDLLV